MIEIKTCPFCGEISSVGPVDPKADGDNWAIVRCKNILGCPVRPFVTHYQDFAYKNIEIRSAACKKRAIQKWNRRY